ncbi:MAG: deoxyguanosinetriphosphate triphosphohydrolase [Candidatus Omnitrophica bacterium]|nr:deoxyguanosinetriphosphate triphosphohydrolase [Candidatus Omnitrophota bacterium]
MKHRPTITIRQALEDHERMWLASYALKSAESKGRVYPEKEHDFRTAFQRDRDRIVHSTAFRRLEYKTQVFVNHEGDHYRTRLTHTLEMTQIARTIGRALRLNEDLIETIALAHDLGHGPFGHAGQDALSGLMKRHGGFEHNRQCLRIIEKLEESYSAFPGLNLTFEVREGLRKHAQNRVRSLEAEVVDCADSIAYNGHDLDDGLRAGLLDIDALEKIKLWQEAYRYIREKSLPGDQTIKRKTAIRLLINRMVSDLISEAMKNISRYHIQKPVDFARSRAKIIAFSRDFEKKAMQVKDFLMEHLYLHHRVVRMTEKGKRFIQELFRLYVAKPEQLPPHVRKRAVKDGLYRAVCDYIAGMTDRFALDEYQKLFSPYERV